MNHFTQHQDIRINAHVRSRLQLITDIILENIPDVKSILLTGGFGKGEGSVKTTNDGRIVCLRDFDIVVIADQIPQERSVRKLYDRIYRSLGLENPEYLPFRFSNFVVDIKFLRKKNLVYPDVWFFDLKVASQILCGEDIRDLIPWSAKDIPASSGLRILFEKVCGLLGLFSCDYLQTEKISEEMKESLLFECYKTFIEMCTALCILAGRYEPKYAQRAKSFEKLYFDKFPELAEALNDLPEKVVKCTDFKLKPDFTKAYEDPVDLWFSTKDYLGIVLRFYIARYLGVADSFNWENLPYHIRKVARQYYKPILKPLIHARLGFSNGALLDVASFLYQTLVNFEYAYAVTRNVARPYFRPLQKFYISPSLKFFQAGTMILFSLNKDGTLEKRLLQRAAEELRHCIPVEISALDICGWDALRRSFLKAYSLYRGYHFVK